MLRSFWLCVFAGALLGVPALSFAPAALAQQATPQVAYRILDPDRLLQNSALGQQIFASNRAAELALNEENAAVAEQLIAEERALTELRSSLSPAEFRARADAFDARVEDIRAERNQRGEDLARRLEAEVQQFFTQVLPVLDQFMSEQGIVGLIRPEMMVLWAEWLDVTDMAIARVDAAFAVPGTVSGTQSGPQPQNP